MRVSILIENGCIIASTIALGSILYVLSSEPATYTNTEPYHILLTVVACRTTPGVHWSWPMIGLFGVTVVAGAVGQAYTDAQTLSIQQDWVVVVARETGGPLGDWNASLRRIDLICKLASPVAFGLIMDFAGDAPMTRAATGRSPIPHPRPRIRSPSPRVACRPLYTTIQQSSIDSDNWLMIYVGAAVVGVWNLLAAPLEYCMRVDTYHFVPALHDQPNQLKKKPTLNFTQYFASWTEYFNHPTFLASFSFCALYMTVLTGDGLNSAYLQWRGVPLSLLGTYVHPLLVIYAAFHLDCPKLETGLSSGLGGLFGFLGTLLFPVLLGCLGSIERVSVWSVWCFWATLVPVWVACVWYGESSVSDYIMMVAVLFSRMWLWSCDLGETQIMQEWVEADRRGSINAMQNATSKLFYIAVLLVSVFCSDPREFVTLVSVSVGAVLSSAIGFTVWYARHVKK
ncbi:hypothetical protein DYB35_000020 [Aphanomyces astaci]|uniref:Solute carrier family 40 member n=1 Tax=Aphanomyces astaci TaxID=112090 RepID=A0A3R6WYC8_APHAT|nr:hypothetical protein DYB35_000020 [Aphanomyces astaci]